MGNYSPSATEYSIYDSVFSIPLEPHCPPPVNTLVEMLIYKLLLYRATQSPNILEYRLFASAFVPALISALPFLKIEILFF